MKKLLYQGIFWRGLNYLTVFMVTIVIARLFKAGDSGEINYLVNNLALLILITTFSLESATTYYSAKEEISQPVLISTSLLMVLLCMMVSAIATKLFFRPGESFAWIPAILYCGGIALINYFTGLFSSHYNYILPNLVSVIVNLCIVVITMVWPAELVADDASLFIKIYFASFLVTGTSLTVLYMRKYGGIVKFASTAELKKLFGYAGFALLTNVIVFLVYRVDYWFVNRNCTPEQLGNYIQVSKLVQIFLLVPGVLAGVIFTTTAKETAHEHLRNTQLLSRLLLSAYVAVLVMLVFVGKWLFPFVYGESFGLMYIPFVLVIPGIITLSTLSLVAAFNAGKGRISLNLAGAVFALVIIVTGNMIFSARFGIYAAAIVSSAGYTGYLFYVLFRLKSTYPEIQMRDFFIPALKDFNLLKSLFIRAK
ncbi:MAG: hypothetical protein EOO02_12465 [Chitinophagaceae bacterium]|nr:MAG: hypothetical protein EOO02_12465 [Chitinophagaceae bacterium]